MILFVSSMLIWLMLSRSTKSPNQSLSPWPLLPRRRLNTPNTNHHYNIRASIGRHPWDTHCCHHHAVVICAPSRSGLSVTLRGTGSWQWSAGQPGTILNNNHALLLPLPLLSLARVVVAVLLVWTLLNSALPSPPLSSYQSLPSTCLFDCWVPPRPVHHNLCFCWLLHPPYISPSNPPLLFLLPKTQSKKKSDCKRPPHATVSKINQITSFQQTNLSPNMYQRCRCPLLGLNSSKTWL